MDVLGQTIEQGEIKPSQKHIDSIFRLGPQKTNQGVRSVLATVQYYSHMIQNLAGITAPLTELIKRDQPDKNIRWNYRHSEALDKTMPVHLRLKHKLCTMMHSIHTGQCPAYLADMVHSVVDSSTRPGLRSADTTDYRKPRCSTKLGQRAFAYAGPLAWNDLPPAIRDISDRTLFRKRLKTFLFNVAA